MKPTSLEGVGSHAGAVIRGWTAPAGADEGPAYVDLQNDSGVNLIEGDVVVVTSDGTIAPTTTASDPRPTGVCIDDIDDGDSGPVQFFGPVDYVNVTASVTAGEYGATSTTTKKAAASASPTGSFVYFTTSGTTPEGFLWQGLGGGSGGGGGSGPGSGTPPWFDVTDPTYGAVGDGTTDDTLAIQAAIDAACAAGGGVIYLPTGDYLVSAEASGQRYAIVLDCNNVTLAGDGMFLTRIRMDPAQTLPAGTVFNVVEIGTSTAGANGVTVRDLCVIANHSSLDGSGDIIEGIAAMQDGDHDERSGDIDIHRVRVSDSNIGILAQKYADITDKDHTDARHYRWSVRDCYVDTTTNKAIEFQMTEDSEIVNCETYNATDGIQVLIHCARVVIAENRVWYVESGINVREGNTDIIVDANQVYAMGGGNAFGGSGAGISLPAGIVIGTERLEVAVAEARLQITNNIVDATLSTSGAAVMFTSYDTNVGATFDDILIAHNVCTGDAHLTDVYNPANSSITGLRVLDNVISGDIVTDDAWSSTRTRLERNHVGDDFTLDADNWDLRGNVIAGTFADTASGTTYDDGYVRNVLVSATPPSAGQVLTAIDADSAEWDDPAGGSLDLDDLTDVTITSPVAADRLRFNGSVWVNSDLHWEPMVDYDGLVMLDSAGGIHVHEVSH